MASDLCVCGVPMNEHCNTASCLMGIPARPSAVPFVRTGEQEVYQERIVRTFDGPTTFSGPGLDGVRVVSSPAPVVIAHEPVRYGFTTNQWPVKFQGTMRRVNLEDDGC